MTIDYHIARVCMCSCDHTQFMAVGCLIAGVAVAYVKFDGSQRRSKEHDAHYVIGAITLAFVCTQMLIAFIRPGLEHTHRWVWTMLHSNWGRLTILVAWANIGLGIYLFDSFYSTTGTRKYQDWTIAAVMLAAFFVVVHVGLDILAWVRPDILPQTQTSHSHQLSKLSSGNASSAEGYSPSHRSHSSGDDMSIVRVKSDAMIKQHNPIFVSESREKRDLASCSEQTVDSGRDLHDPEQQHQRDRV